MKRFNFPLERVRRWRGEQADLEAMKLERLFGDLSALERQRAQLLMDRAEAEGILNMQQPLPAAELSNLDSFRQYVQARCQSIEGLKQLQQDKIAKQREVLMEASRQYELLERLRKRNLLKWKTESDREQEALATEMFLARWNS